MLIDKTNGYLDEVKKFAADHGLTDKLQEKLGYLDGFACTAQDPHLTECHLFRDFAPYSFSFLLRRRPTQQDDYRDWINGGVIFYQGRTTGAGAPQYCVTLSNSDEARWEIHT